MGGPHAIIKWTFLHRLGDLRRPLGLLLCRVDCSGVEVTVCRRVLSGERPFEVNSRPYRSYTYVQLARPWPVREYFFANSPAGARREFCQKHVTAQAAPILVIFRRGHFCNAGDGMRDSVLARHTALADMATVSGSGYPAILGHDQLGPGCAV